jgi:hypothetical protein
MIGSGRPGCVQKNSKDKATLLKPEQGYPAGFRFTNDMRYLVRMHKTGSGEATLYLHRQGSLSAGQGRL